MAEAQTQLPAAAMTETLQQSYDSEQLSLELCTPGSLELTTSMLIRCAVALCHNSIHGGDLWAQNAVSVQASLEIPKAD